MQQRHTPTERLDATVVASYKRGHRYPDSRFDPGESNPILRYRRVPNSRLSRSIERSITERSRSRTVIKLFHYVRLLDGSGCRGALKKVPDHLRFPCFYSLRAIFKRESNQQFSNLREQSSR